MQIDYILIKRRHFTTVTDYKAVPYETITTQHRPLIAVLRIKPSIKWREERTGLKRIKWWRFPENKEEMISLTRLPTITNVEESWNQMKNTIQKAASETLGGAKPGKRHINRDTLLWNDDVKFLGKQRKQSLSPERTITKIFTINWTLGICIDLPKAEMNAHRIPISTIPDI